MVLGNHSWGKDYHRFVGHDRRENVVRVKVGGWRWEEFCSLLASRGELPSAEQITWSLISKIARHWKWVECSEQSIGPPPNSWSSWAEKKRETNYIPHQNCRQIWKDYHVIYLILGMRVSRALLLGLAVLRLVFGPGNQAPMLVARLTPTPIHLRLLSRLLSIPPSWQ